MNDLEASINLNLSPQRARDVIKWSRSNTLSHVSAPRILLVEDESKLLSHLERILQTDGFSTFTCSSFTDLEGILRIPSIRFDVIVLDRLLHGRDAAALVAQMKRALPDVKILVLSAINTGREKAHLLDLGADDYVAKPFSTDELTARIRALMRRSQPELRFANMVLNFEKRTVRINDQELSLQNKEFLLLKTLVRTPGRVFNKTFLHEHVWEVNPEVESNVVEATVNKLRRRLEESGAKFSIKSTRNKGYWVEE